VLVMAVAAGVVGTRTAALLRDTAQPAATAVTTTTVATGGQGGRRAPDTLGGMPRTDPFGTTPVRGGVVPATYGTSAADTVSLIANPPGMDRGAKWRAGIRSSRPDELAAAVTFHRVPIDGLDIWCTDDQRAFKACYIVGPKLEIDITGSGTPSRLADLLAEAYRRMGG
jgi:hypothetical protein